MTPTIETERLRLRAHREEDFAACAAMWADENVLRFITGKPSTEQQTWSRMLAYRGHWELKGFGYWAVEDKNTHEFAGEIGFADFKRDINAWPKGTPEIGFAFATPFHGMGYATECVGAVLAWADAHLSNEQTACMIAPQNEASLRVAQKFGYAVIKEGAYNEMPVLFLTRPSPLPRKR
jgi:RimJ/RimL family protein N-acetyltransferase